MLNPKLIAIAIFLTATIRLIPLPLSDTQRSIVLAAVIFLLGLRNARYLNFDFIKNLWPLFALLLLATIIDILLGRVGYYNLLFLVKFATLIIVGNVVFTLPIRQIKQLLMLCTVILVAQLGLFFAVPEYFAAMGHGVGIEDSFTLHGNVQDRYYYAYFQSNRAAYTIFYMFLSWIAVASFGKAKRIESLAFALVLIGLAVGTGSRGLILLLLPFILGRMLLMRSTAAVTFFSAVPILLLAASTIVDATIDLMLLREESNVARLDAITTYVAYIKENFVFGVGWNVLRFRVDALGEKPSHVAFIELVASYGIFIGGAIIWYLINLLIRRPPGAGLKQIGFFALATGLFYNDMLLLPSFFALIVPIAARLSIENRKAESSAVAAMQPQADPRHHY